MYHVGQRVVCIEDNGGMRTDVINAFGLTAPSKNKVYTIRAIDKSYQNQRTIILLSEIVNHVRQYVSTLAPFEPWFDVSCFRPLDEKRIDVFRKLLVPIKSKVS